MVTRRKFLGAFAGLTALTALAGAGIRLPKRTEVEVDPTMADPNGWRIETSFSNNAPTGVTLTEQSLQDILNQMKESPARLRINKLIVPPRLGARAQEILEYAARPRWHERLVNWLFSEAA